MSASPSSSPNDLILVVNQSAETLSLIRSILEESGFRVLVANRFELDGDDLLAFVAEHRPDLVLYDIPYPYDERLAAFQALRGADTPAPKTRWMAISSSSRIVELLAGLGVPVTPKPFDIEQFVEAVVSAIRPAG